MSGIRAIARKQFYEVTYRHFRAPWDIGARSELVALVEGRRISPCRAIDLGCGAGANAIYLAQRGFDVTAVDYAAAAIAKACARAREAGVPVNFVVDDLTNLGRVSGAFDFLVDYGTLDDPNLRPRDSYLRSLLPLTRPGSQFLLWASSIRCAGGSGSRRSTMVLSPGSGP